jgi:2-succinyl-5-enolpyruvyl-6-hydroxy-3-cyclohexene-1-carboxylate synthase
VNPKSVQCAQSVINALLMSGVKNFVIAPGSRNGPLSLALVKAQQNNLINLAVRLDERSAAFVALGMALKFNEPAAVVCTSGTAVANLLPALIEARYSNIPLIAITADRPKALINTGINQTIEQDAIFSKVTDHRLILDSDSGTSSKWQKSTLKFLEDLAKSPGPMHLNIHLAEPLVPAEDFWFEEVGQFKFFEHDLIELPADFINKKGLIIAGASNLASDEYVNDLAKALNWPLVAEAPSLAYKNKVSHHPAVLPLLDEEFNPEVLLLVGRVGLSRAVASLINKTARKIYIANPSALDKVSGELVTERLAKLPLANSENSWVGKWTALNKKTEPVVTNRKQVQSDLLQVVKNIFSNIVDNSHLHLSSSLSARDFELMLCAEVAQELSERGITLSMNRGVNGIDGVVSTAFGLALTEPARAHYCLLGDVATIYDLPGFALPKGESAINLHFIIVDNDGGGIFSTLEQAGIENFDRAYSAPHGINLLEVLQTLGVKVVSPGAKLEIKSAPGLSVQIFKVEPKTKIKEVRAEIHSQMKLVI